jgi:hypothetical protein
MAVISPDVAQLVAEYRNSDTNMQNVFYVQKLDGWAAGDLEQLAENYLAWETAEAGPLRSNQISLTRVTVTDLTSLTHGRYDLQLASPLVGGLASPALPASATWALKKNIGQRGRGRNGRTFWIGLGENQVVQDTIDSAAASAIETAMNMLLSDLLTDLGGAEVGVIHRPPVGTGEEYDFTRQLVYAATDFLIDSQRDRLPGHKRHKRRPGVGA